MDKQQLTLEAFELQTGHYSCLIHALGVAMTRCIIWRYTDTDKKYDLLQLYRFAEGYDKEHPLEDHAFYMVTAEGAIGVSPGMEYLTKWLFIPAMDEESIAKLQADIQQLEAQAKAEEEAAKRDAEEKARKEAEEKARQEAEAQAAAKPKFCPECGTPYKKLTSKFCENCGAPRKS